MDLVVQILISGFIIGAIYALGAAGMTIIFGVSGILNLARGTIMVAAALIAWYAALHLHFGTYLGALAEIGAAIVVTYLLYLLVIIPLQRSRHIGAEELQVFQLVATMLFALILEGILDWSLGSAPVSTPPLIEGGVHIGSNVVPINSLLIGAVAWVVLIGLWLFVSHTRLGKAMLAASMSPKGLAIIGYNINRIHFLVWGLYGLLAGIAGVLLASFIGASSSMAINLTAISFTIVILGGLGNVLGSLVGAYILGFLSTITAFLVSSSISELPGLILLIRILYIRPQGLFGRR
jgi:branched-chain amino acid transport system permease protein